MMQPSKTFTSLAFISVLPLLYTLLLAMHHHFGWTAFTGIDLTFAHINAYIFAHSYAALLLALYAGIQIGMVLTRTQHSGYVLFNFVLIGMAWLSYQSYADFLGITLLCFCWLVTLALDWHAKQMGIIPVWYATLKVKLNVAVLLLLCTLLWVNG